ncbi:unnamed protein product, partial [Ectocarpus sp. 4 AP-2014]
MTFCTFSPTNHVLTAFPICEGVGFTDSVPMMSASSRNSSISGVATCVPTPMLPLVSESDEKNELLPLPLDVVLLSSSTPKFRTRLLVLEEIEDTETVGEGTTNVGDGGGGGGGVGGAASVSEPISILFTQSR